jgi:hypothetical protein
MQLTKDESSLKHKEKIENEISTVHESWQIMPSNFGYGRGMHELEERSTFKLS